MTFSCDKILGWYLDKWIATIHSFDCVKLEIWTDFKSVTILRGEKFTRMILAVSGFYLKESKKRKQKGSAFSSDSLLWQMYISQVKMVIVEPGIHHSVGEI